MSERLRVAIISPWHPEYSNGGTQVASYSQFLNLKDRTDVEPTYVARCAAQMLGHSGAFGTFRGRRNEILWVPPPMDDFRIVTKAPSVLRRQARELVARLAPEVVHLHHYLGFGTDLIRIFKEELGLPVVVTLHEFGAICNRSGQMLKTNGDLCYESSYAECSACFPERSAGKFFLRKALIMENFGYVDKFIAPSKFLAARYVDWGIEADRIRVIENSLPRRHVNGDASPTPADPNGVIRFAYFGQFTPYKGIDVLLRAVAALDDEVRKRIKVLLYGFTLNREGSELQKLIASQIDALQDCVVLRGKYRNEDVVDLMQAVNWIVVPSIWWENSPVVIQEAKRSGVPVLCSNIGGMREKVAPGVDGAHFRVSDPLDLAEKISMITKGELTIHREAQLDDGSATAGILDLYRKVLKSRSAHGATAETAPLERIGSR